MKIYLHYESKVYLCGIDFDMAGHAHPVDEWALTPNNWKSLRIKSL